MWGEKADRLIPAFRHLFSGKDRSLRYFSPRELTVLSGLRPGDVVEARRCLGVREAGPFRNFWSSVVFDLARHTLQ